MGREKYKRVTLDLNHHLRPPISALVTIASSSHQREQGSNPPPSAVIPATRPHSVLDYDQPDQPDPSTTDISRARKRPRTDFGSRPAMRLSPDNGSTLSVSPDPSESFAGPSSTQPTSTTSSAIRSTANGHNTHANGSNGFLAPPTKNSSSSNGALSRNPGKSIARVNLPGKSLYEGSNVNREEFVRFVIQALHDVGYIESAATLEAESGYKLEGNDVGQFRRYILEGSWDHAENALLSLGAGSDEALWDARFLLNRQRYLELLEARRTSDALHVLRNNLTPLVPPDSDSEHIHTLSSLIMCADPEDVRRRANWDGASGASRQQLLEELQSYISPSVMLPQRRLDTLLEQARQHQHSNCMYHNAPPSDFSLYADHICDANDFPRDTTTVLDAHTDEVWCIAWSHDGLSLASAGQDKKAVIWQLGPESDPAIREWKVAHILRDHSDPVGCIAWSMDDSVLATGSEAQIKLWNTKTGLCTQVIDVHMDAVSSLAWLPDGSGFISAGLDRHIYQWDSEGRRMDSWGPTSIRITDIAISPDGAKLITIGMEFNSQVRHAAHAPPTTPAQTPPRSSPTRMIVYDFRSKEILSDVDFEGELTSVNISQDSQFAVLNHAPDEIRIWDLANDRLAAKLHGQSQGTHIIRSCFGGMNDNFVASGSEDGNVYIWHRHSEKLVEILPGHGAGSVNVVSWNPRNERMFASGSDDHTIRIWEALSSTPSHTEAFDTSTSATTNTKGKSKISWNGDNASQPQPQPSASSSS